jgi:hypothetical protein
MKRLSEKKALEMLSGMISDFKSEISNRFEHRAKNCLTCEVKGSCCLDAHFVNVHISRLEAVNASRVLGNLPKPLRERVGERVRDSIERYGLQSEGDTYSQTYACPLFEPGIGCLIHDVKPAACTIHACYENKIDLPPDRLQVEQELKIDRLNERVYGQRSSWLPLPLALKRASEAEARALARA